MADYIDRYDALNAINDAISNHPLSYEDCVNEAMGTIAQIPPADVVERKTGKWIYRLEAYPLGNPYGHYDCNQCGKSVPTKTNFCPNCGSYNGGDDDV